MADVKTTLRELSVLVGVKDIIERNDLCFEGDLFYKKVLGIIGRENDNIISNISTIHEFSNEEKTILHNGYNLSSFIIRKFGIKSIEKLKWYGFDTQKENPVDICINNILFSLKEDSFILENMGLYKFVNLLTGSHYKSLHIFQNFASREYQEWFNTSWSLLLSYLSTKIWTSNHKGNVVSITLNKDSVIMKYGDIVKVLPKECSISQFRERTIGTIREEVFAKWISDNIENNSEYRKAKKRCAEEAGKNLVKYINDHLNYNSGIARLLRIHDEEYYYAKTTMSGCEIYKVPALKDFQEIITIESIDFSVPDSQLNIMTKIKNSNTKNFLIFRNECRFSHGQFNGTPEAKMYYGRNNKLIAIYDQI